MHWALGLPTVQGKSFLNLLSCTHQLGTGTQAPGGSGVCIWASFGPGPAFSSQFLARRRDRIENRREERCGENRAPPRSPLNPSPHTGKRVGCTSGAATQLSAPEALGPGVLLGPKGSPEVSRTFLKPPSLRNSVLSQPLTSLHPSQKAGSRTRGLGLPPAARGQQRQTLALEHTFWSDHPFNDVLSKHQHEPQPNSMVTAPGQNHLRPLRRPSSPDSCHGLSQGPLHGSCSGIWPQPEWERVGMESPDVRSSLNCVNWGESHYLSEPRFPCGGVRTHLRGLLWKTATANADLGASPVRLAPCQTLYVQHLHEPSSQAS